MTPATTRPRARCPRCQATLRAITTAGPGRHTASPCGHRIDARLLGSLTPREVTETP